MHVLSETSYLNNRFFIRFSENGLAGYRTGHTEFAHKIIVSISPFNYWDTTGKYLTINFRYFDHWDLYQGK